MIVVETDPIQQSFEPWTVVADENGNFQTSWYIFSQEFNGASFLATATGESSQLTASCTFTDATLPYYIAPNYTTANSTVTFEGIFQNTSDTVGSFSMQVPSQPTGANGWVITSGSVTAASAGDWTTPATITGGPATSTIHFTATANDAVPVNGWVRFSITAHVGNGTGSENWTANTWSHTGENSHNDNAKNVGLITNVCDPNGRLASVMFVKAAATLVTASSASATNIKVSNVTGFAIGQTVLIDNAGCPGPSNQETRTITNVGTAGTGGTGITLTPALTLAHTLGETVAVPDTTASSGTPHNYQLLFVFVSGDAMGHADIYLPTPWTGISNISIDARSSVGGWVATHGAGITSPIDNEISIYKGTDVQVDGNFIMLDFTATAPTGGLTTLTAGVYNGGAGRATGDVFQTINQPSITITTPTPTPTPTATATATATATFTPTPSATFTPTPSATFTPTATATFTPTASATFTPTATATFTPTATATFTPTATATFTPTATATFTPTATATFTPTATATFTPTATATFTPTATATFTPTATATFTPTPTAYSHIYADSYRYIYPDSHGNVYADGNGYSDVYAYAHADGNGSANQWQHHHQGRRAPQHDFGQHCYPGNIMAQRG